MATRHCESLEMKDDGHTRASSISLENNEMLSAALAKGSKPWGRSKIMIVGEGRTGKTALSRSILGEPFVHTESTIGITQLTCDVHYIQVGHGSGDERGEDETCVWSPFSKPAKELEAALAMLVLREKSDKATVGKRKREIISTGNAANDHAR